MTLSSEELNLLNHQGFIAGPGESESDFKKRVEYCRGLKEEMEELPADEILKESHALTRTWFDIAPDWIPCLFSNHQLALWHGGCAWIFQKDDRTPTGAFLQLRKTFYRNSTFLGIYKRNEFIAHELCHVGRMMFEEPRFEEVLAYQTASSPLQRIFGPLVRSATEAIIFVITIMMLLMVDIMILASGYFSIYHQLMWFKLIPLGLILFALGRLLNARSTFKKSFNQLEKVLGSPELTRAVIYRLTDQEIDDFAKMSSDEIRSFVEQSKEKELRWQQIYTYFSRR
ncbi:MAG: hypothetical protein K940chlam3_00541 [Chlamydiae bacterium]|nr:hypothetical protein [Chlamydiota bacterium]